MRNDSDVVHRGGARRGAWSNRFAVLAAALLGIAGVVGGFAACGSSNHSNGSGDDGGGGDATVDGTGDDGNGGDGSNTNEGGPQADAGTVGIDGSPFGDGGCYTLGTGCTSNGECCSGTCTNGVCDYPACVSNGGACTSNSQCCTLTCTGGKCAALAGSGSCKSLGNTCTSASDCCSGRCAGGTCQPSSWCSQTSDICQASADCCSGSCTIPSGQTVGTCAAPMGGMTNCTMVDGMLCGGVGQDGGVVYTDGGIPACGGSCCSRSCAPWGPTGVLVCQPATGCHVVGDTCITSNDCCGSAAFADAGLPTSQQPVVCMNGICTLPSGCDPTGDVCKIATTSCNARVDCCTGKGNFAGVCKQDNLGIPRCALAQCADAGGACATSADCCNGNPCLPNPGGNPPYVCYGSACVPSCGPCTTNGDCCPGSSCVLAPGSVTGTCGPCGGTTGDGGTTGGGDGGTTGGGDGGTGGGTDGGCTLYGQICTTSSDCCNGVPCTNGRCETPVF